MQSQTSFKIEVPKVGDELFLGPMHVKAWKQTYTNAELGITEEMIEDMVGFMATQHDHKRNTILESLSKPDMVLYRVVRNDHGNIVGFLHGSKDEEFNILNALYLLDEAKGAGVGDALMQEFLAWSDKSKPCHLEVFSSNHRAIRFYSKYGFEKTQKSPEMYKDKIPFIEMVRLGENNSRNV